MPRHLAAILAADVVGYSSLMTRDEQGTLTQLKALRREVFDPLIGKYSGRVVKLMGDGALVEFTSVVDAVSCAIAIQTGIRDDPEQMMRLRIGVNLGDVIAEGGDIYGDGVNVAARLEALAEPGGICISDIVRQGIGRRIDASFTDAGEHVLKNIEQPVHLFHWVPDGDLKQVLPTSPRNATDTPGIAVLAFDNMSTDPEQEYFSDGIAEDIITALSHFREFFVIARNTTFTYKGQAIRVDELCRELGVRYLLEGSVRKAGNRVRVTAQLIDGETGAHIWAARFDRELDDIFAVQDEITQAIVSAVAPETLDAELKRAQSKPPENLNAWDKVLQARWHMARMTRSDHVAARALLEQAVAEDPTLSHAYVELATCDLRDMLHLWQSDIRAAIQSAVRHADRARELDPNNASALAVLGMTAAFNRQYEDAFEYLERAVSLNPNLASGYGNQAALHGLENRYGKAKESAALALALSPRDPARCFWLAGVGIGAFIAEEYEDCVTVSRQVLKDFPGYASSLRQEAAALAMLGRETEAGAAMERLLDRMPGLTVSQVRHMVPVRYPDDAERWLEGLRRAGLPE